jgi:predicted membrane-bound spermidine synthase
MTSLPAILLFVSGAAALVYQTLWVKQLGLVVGVDVYAVTATVSAFFAGLAFGSAFFGRRADRTARPLLMIAGLEIGIAVLGLGGTLALSRSPRTFVTLKAMAGPLAWALPFVLIGLPAFLMGGTLPTLLRAIAPKDQTIGGTSGFLYAANTFGAIGGTLAVPFFLVPVLGISGTALAAASCNLVVAVVAFAASRRYVSHPGGSAKRTPLNTDTKLALGLYALAGGVALGYEVVWSQAIVPFLSSRAYAFAVMLATYLSGLVLGSFLYARFADRSRRPWTVFGLLVGGAGASALLIFAGIGPGLLHMQDAIGKAAYSLAASNMLANSARFAFTAAALLLIPTILLGAAFPAAARLAAGAAHIGRDIGTVAALNMAGGIAGTFLTGFVLVPVLGLIRTLGALAVAAASIGGIAVIRGGRRRGPSIALAAAMVIAVVFVAARMPPDKLARLLESKRGGKLVFYEESPGGTIAVLKNTASAGAFHRLYIQGVSNSGDSITSLRYMRLQALLPLLIHKGKPRSALVIGFGTGITAGALLAYPGLEQRVCVELLPAVVRAAPSFQGNLGVARDSRVEVRIRDGRHELLASAERYDLITLEPPPPSAAGVVNLYSQDFYELARDRLQPDGLFAQWWPLATQNDEDSQSLVRSFIDVFRYVTLWTTELHETLLIGSNQPIELHGTRIQSRFRQQEVAAALRDVGVLSATELLATYVTDGNGLEDYAGDALPVTDDRPRIEYAGWVREGEFPRVLMRIAELRSDPPLQGSDKSLQNDVLLARQKLWTLYRAGYYVYTGQADRWESMIKRLLPEMNDNPYFRWFITDKQ